MRFVFTEISKLAKSATAIQSPPIIGQLYAAKYAWDGNWYRCKVDKRSDELHSNITFIDFGSDAIVRNNQLIPLPDNLRKVQPLCKKYKILGATPVNISDAHIDKGKKWLVELTSGQPVKAHIVSETSRGYNAECFLGPLSLAKAAVELGHARYSNFYKGKFEDSTDGLGYKKYLKNKSVKSASASSTFTSKEAKRNSIKSMPTVKTAPFKASPSKSKVDVSRNHLPSKATLPNRRVRIRRGRAGKPFVATTAAGGPLGRRTRTVKSKGKNMSSAASKTTSGAAKKSTSGVANNATSQVANKTTSGVTNNATTKVANKTTSEVANKTTSGVANKTASKVKDKSVNTFNDLTDNCDVLVKEVYRLCTSTLTDESSKEECIDVAVNLATSEQYNPDLQLITKLVKLQQIVNEYKKMQERILTLDKNEISKEVLSGRDEKREEMLKLIVEYEESCNLWNLKDKLDEIHEAYKRILSRFPSAVNTPVIPLDEAIKDYRAINEFFKNGYASLEKQTEANRSNLVTAFGELSILFENPAKDSPLPEILPALKSLKESLRSQTNFLKKRNLVGKELKALVSSLLASLGSRRTALGKYHHYLGNYKLCVTKIESLKENKIDVNVYTDLEQKIRTARSKLRRACVDLLDIEDEIDKVEEKADITAKVKEYKTSLAQLEEEKRCFVEELSRATEDYPELAVLYPHIKLDQTRPKQDSVQGEIESVQIQMEQIAKADEIKDEKTLKVSENGIPSSESEEKSESKGLEQREVKKKKHIVDDIKNNSPEVVDKQ